MSSPDLDSPSTNSIAPSKSNPYVPPKTTSIANQTPTNSAGVFWTVFSAWESKRWLYNGVLIVVTGLHAAYLLHFDIGTWEGVQMLAESLPLLIVVANICYSVGSLLELILFPTSRVIRAIMFWLGTLFASYLAYYMTYDAVVLAPKMVNLD